LHNVVTVPSAAIQRGAPGTYVYVINADDTVSVRPISVGPTDAAMVHVKSGLTVGERVVVDGTDRLRDGARVTIPAANGQAPGAAAPAAPAGSPAQPPPAGAPAPAQPGHPPAAGAPGTPGQPQHQDHSQNRRNNGGQ
jgi:multidrug efflux system membrane fusion protein